MSGHRCQRPQLYMIEDVPLDSLRIQDQPPHQNDLILDISVHNITRTNHPQIIRVLGKIQNNITYLVDGGNT